MTDNLPKGAMHVINSNDINCLAFYCSWIIKNLKADSHSSPFNPEKIIVMNKGMKSYLQQRIADYADVCAGVEFNQVWEFIWDIHKRLNHGDAFNRFNHEHLTWAIFKAKNIWGNRNLDENEDPYSDYRIFSSMRNYLSDKEDVSNVDSQNEARIYQLCGVIADALDQYQMYRPDWIKIWNEYSPDDSQSFRKLCEKWKKHVLKNKNGNDRVFLEETLDKNLWQVRLWTIIKENLPKRGNSPEANYDRAQVVDSLIALIQKKKDEPDFIKQLPKRVFIFGVTSLPTQVLYFFSQLGKVIPVFFMNLNPCKEYWGDIQTEHEGRKAEKEKIFRYLKAMSLPKVERLPENLHLKDNASEISQEIYLDNYRKYFDDEENNLVEGNPLLISLGKQGRDTLNELFSMDTADTKVDFSNIFVQNILKDDSSSDTILNHIKEDLLNLKERSEKIKVSSDDKSLQIRSCHTIRREVEVLRDEILSLIKLSNDKDKHINAQDKLSIFSNASVPSNMLVMVPDIEKYAPYIESVFGSLNSYDDSVKIPYAICDQSSKNSGSVADAVLKLLSMGGKTITANLIIELLSIKPIAEKFGITSDDLSVIISWLKATGVHWGLDDTDVEAVLDEKIALPWTLEKGLDRLIEGFVFGDNSVNSGYADFDSADYELLNKFCRFYEQLKKVRDEFNPYAEAESSNWTGKLDELLLKGFFVDNEETQFECDGIRNILSEMTEAIGNLSSANASKDGLEKEDSSDFQIRLPVFMAKLEHAFGNTSNSSQYLRGKLNFCSLMPMRAVPFDHIFILGLNDLDFPRKDNVPSFNLLGIPALFRRNDRSRINDDRYIFLEALLSAQKSLYLSYLGQSPVNNEELNPSVVLKELEDYVKDHFELEPKSDEDKPDEDKLSSLIFRKERLNSYDPENFKENKELGRFSSFNREFFYNRMDANNHIKTKALGYLGEGLNPCKFELNDTITVGISDLVSFFKNPCKVFLKKRLGINLNVNSDTNVSDREPFKIDTLQRGSLINELEASLNENKAAQHTDIEDNLNKLLSIKKDSGLLPTELFFENEADSLKDSLVHISEFLGGIRDNNSGKEYRFCFEIPFDEKIVNVVFEGILSNHSNVIINYYSDRLLIDGKETDPIWLIEAFLRAAAHRHTKDGICQADDLYVLNSSGNSQKIVFPADTNFDNFLKRLVEIYVIGQYIPLPFDKGLLTNVEKRFNSMITKENPHPDIEIEELLRNLDLKELLSEDETLYMFKSAEGITQKEDYISELQFNCVCDLMNMYLKEMQIIPEISSEE